MMSIKILVMDLALRTIMLNEMMDIIDYALKVYQDKEKWQGLVHRAMEAKLDWDKSADAYLKVFNSLLD